MGKFEIKHGMSQTPLHQIWRSMKQRCNNKNRKDYERYGGRNITYDKKWETFEGFYEDMGSSYKEGLSIERKDVNGNYSIENCIWIPIKDQARNKRNNKYILFKQEKFLAVDLVEKLFNEYDIKYPTIRYIVYYCSDDIERLLKKYKLRNT